MRLKNDTGNERVEELFRPLLWTSDKSIIIINDLHSLSIIAIRAYVLGLGRLFQLSPSAVTHGRCRAACRVGGLHRIRASHVPFTCADNIHLSVGPTVLFDVWRELLCQLANEAQLDQWYADNLTTFGVFSSVWKIEPFNDNKYIPLSLALL